MKASIGAVMGFAVVLGVGAGPAWAGTSFDQLKSMAAEMGLPGPEAVPIPIPVPQPVPAPAETPLRSYQVVPERSTIECRAKAGPFEATATFRRYDVKLAFDPADLPRSRMEVTVDVKSVESQTIFVSDGMLRRRLKADQFPSAVMRSTALRATAEPGFYDADVEIVVMGETYQKTLAVGITPEGQDLHIVGALEFTLNDGHRVTERYDIVLRPADAAALSVQTAR